MDAHDGLYDDEPSAWRRIGGIDLAAARYSG